MAFSYGWRGPNIVKDGLVLYLDAGSPNSFYSPTAGTIWKDISGNNNNGTLTNGPTFNSANGGSIVFDGVNDFIALGDNNFRFDNRFSISVWIYWNGINQFAPICMKRNSDPPYSQYGISFYDSITAGGTSNKINFAFISSIGYPSNYGNLAYALTGAGWYNVIGTLSESSQQLYVNGIQRASSTISFASANFNVPNKNLTIGSDSALSRFFNGNVSQITIYNRTLSSQEILQNYNATKGRFGL